jgi:hypothetical protein
MSKTATEVAYRAQISLGRISFRFILEKLWLVEPVGIEPTTSSLQS